MLLLMILSNESEDMVSARCFVGMGRYFTFPAPSGQEQEPVVELERKGFICRPGDHRPDQGHDDDRWCLTSKAASACQVHLRLEKPAPVFVGRKDVPLEEKTALELLEALKGHGFTLLDDDASLAKFKGTSFTGQRGPRRFW